jgi:ferredoxin
MVLVRPRCGADWLSFSNTTESIREGYRAALSALDGYEAYLEQPGGIFPRRQVSISVAREKCVGCGMCVALAPNIMGLDPSGIAFARTRSMDWSPADGDFVNQCPTNAIEVTRAAPETFEDEPTRLAG